MSFFSLIGMGIGYAVGGPGGAALGGTLGGYLDNSNAQNQSTRSRTAIADAVRNASLTQISANNIASQSSIGFQQATMAGVAGSIDAMKQAASASLAEIGKQTKLVKSQSIGASERTEGLTIEQAAAIRSKTEADASSLQNSNAQIEALARAYGAASGVTTAGTPSIYMKELTKTDATRVNDIINAGDRNEQLILMQGQNRVAEIQASAAMAIAGLHAQATNIQGQLDVNIASGDAKIAETQAYIGVIGATNDVNNANISANAAQYGVDLTGNPKEKPKPIKNPYRVNGEVLAYR